MNDHWESLITRNSLGMVASSASRGNKRSIDRSFPNNEKADQFQCDETQLACGSCKKRKVTCQYPPRLALGTFNNITEAAAAVQEISRDFDEPIHIDLSPLSCETISESVSYNSGSSEGSSESETSIEDMAKIQDAAPAKRALVIAGIPSSIQCVPWQNRLEHRLWDVYYDTHRESLGKPEVDVAVREVWLNLVPRVALTADRTLFKLLLSLGSIYSAIKTSDYPAIESGSLGAKLWNLSNFFFSDAISNFRSSITSKKMYENTPEVFCVIALVLSFRSSMNANHRHTDVYSLYDDMLSWFSAALGYIALGGFYTKKLRDTQLGDIMKANPSATYHFYPFLEYIKTHNFLQFHYLHPMSDPVNGNLDPEDSTDEALEAYTISLKLIGWVYQAAAEGALPSDVYGMFQTVPYTVPNHFLSLLRRKKPRAIAVLAHHTALTAFLGVHERFNFWPREHIILLQTLVPMHWSWAFQKAIEVVGRAEELRSSGRPMTLSVHHKAPAFLDAVDIVELDS